MVRILAYTYPGHNHPFTLTPILDEFRGRGHEIALRTLASPVVPASDELAAFYKGLAAFTRPTSPPG